MRPGAAGQRESTQCDPALLVQRHGVDRHRLPLAATRLALVDHELAHCGQKETTNRRSGRITKSWYIVGHDIEEFSAIVQRHGWWSPDRKAFGLAIPQQLPLDEPDPPPPGRKERRTTVEPNGIVVSTEQLQAEPPATNGVDHEPGWQERAGIGGEHEQRRRGRAKANA